MSKVWKVKTKEVKPKRKSRKGKRHPAHATSFLNVANILFQTSAGLMPEARQAVERVASAMQTEGKRLRKIVR